MTDPARIDDRLVRFRTRFPHLDEMVHLSSCSQGALSTDLNGALFELQHTMRAQGAPWQEWVGEVERARKGYAAYINCRPDEVAIVGCASDAAYQVASSLSWDRRARIVTTDMEFPSIAHVWLAQRDRGAELVHVPHREGIVRPEDYRYAIDERCRLVSVPLSTYRNGARMPVREVTDAARSAGARVFVDGYQACGVIPVDVRELDCDYFVAGTLKYMLGLPGLAFLYVRGGITDDVPPQLTGWFGQRDPFEFDPRNLDFAHDARRFQTGTPAIPSAYAANAGLRALEQVPARVIDEHVRDLVSIAHDTLNQDGELLFSPADPDLRGPMVAVADDDPEQLTRFLSAHRISASPRGDYLRLSFHGYNDTSDIATVCEAIRRYRKEIRPAPRSLTD